MSVPFLSAAELGDEGAIDGTIAALEALFPALARGEVQSPDRTLLITEKGPPARQMLTGAAAWPARDVATVKITTLTPKNPEAGRPLVNGLVVVTDLSTGLPLALADGGALTGLRTGALAGLAARHLSAGRTDSLAIIGAGVQARWGLLALCRTVRFETLFLASRSRSGLDAFARWARPRLPERVRLVVKSDAQSAVKNADIVLCATSTDRAEPVLADGWLPSWPAPLLIGVGGANEDALEFDPATAAKAQCVVEDRAAALAEGGELRACGATEEQLVALADIIEGRAQRDASRPCLFRAVGLAAEDLAAALAVLDRAGGAATGPR